MARSRNLKPSFFMNEVLADCSPLARILFAGLWTIADREGRLEDRPKKIKAALLPYDNCDAEELLCELDRSGFILRYEVEKSDYIQIVTFKIHQNPHQKEQPSLIPGPENAVLVPDMPESCLVQDHDLPCLNPLPESLNPLPESLSTGEISFEGTLQTAGMLFEIFWNEYPKIRPRGNRAEASTKFLKLLKDGVSHDEIINGTRKYATYCKNTGSYNKDASVFLNPKNRLWAGDWDDSTESTGRSGMHALAEGARRTLRHDGHTGPVNNGLQALPSDEQRPSDMGEEQHPFGSNPRRGY